MSSEGATHPEPRGLPGILFGVAWGEAYRTGLQPSGRWLLAAAWGGARRLVKDRALGAEDKRKRLKVRALLRTRLPVPE